MPTITYQGKRYECNRDEFLLDSLNKQGTGLASGCHGGQCHVCIIKVIKGKAPSQPQTDVKTAMKEKGYFLPCICKPQSDIEISQPERRDRFITANVSSVDFLNRGIIRLCTTLPPEFEYRPGQFVNLVRAEDELMRSYSIASIPNDQQLEFHIRLLPNGKMSSWIANALQCGDKILMSEAKGQCYYQYHDSDRPLLLAGTGTGLAPLYGILRDALTSGHQARISLLQGAKSADELYYTAQLRQLAEQYKNFTYTPSVLNGDAPEGGLTGPIDAHIPELLASNSDWISFLCGDSGIVGVMRRCCFSHGVESSDIHCDAFV